MLLNCSKCIFYFETKILRFSIPLSHLTLTCWPIMQKVRSYFQFTWAAYKTTIWNLSLTVLLTIAYISYLALEKGFPIFKQISIAIRFTLKAYHLYISSYFIKSVYNVSYFIKLRYIFFIFPIKYIKIKISFDFFSWS